MPIIRTGLQTAVRIANSFCKLYVVWKPKMVVAIDNYPDISDSQKTAAKAALEAMMLACDALDILRLFYEP